MKKKLNDYILLFKECYISVTIRLEYIFSLRESAIDEVNASKISQRLIPLIESVSAHISP